MIITPVSVRGAAAVRDALLSHGWEGDIASLAAAGLTPAGFHVRNLSIDVIEAMVPLAARLGLELVTGEDWLFLAGPRSRLGAFARPWVQPEPVRELAQAIGMAMPADLSRTWRHARGEVNLDGPVVIGILNTTPDSFSASSRALAAGAVLERVEFLIAGGAAMIDVGGESTRPGSAPVSLEVEAARVLPAIELIGAHHPSVPISIDTVHAETARVALAAGAVAVNDVTGGRHDPDLLYVVAEQGAGIVLTHSRGELGSLASYEHAGYQDDVSGQVTQELAETMAHALAAGILPDQVVLDPGFGFGKTTADSLAMLDGLDALVALGRPVMIGPSRKRFLGEITGRDVEDRDRATAAACALGFDRGARLFRVHDPEAVRDALLVAAAAVQRS